MTKGESICSVLKTTIRKQVADANKIKIVGILVGLLALTGCSDKAIKVDSVSEERELTKRIVEPVPMPNPYLNPDFHEKVFDVVEQMPSFPGGQQKLMEYLYENIRYPEELAEASIQGRVIVIFVVEKDGSISHVKVAKSVDPLLDKEAVRVVSAMPKWNPGKQSGVAVRVKYVIPVTFRLQTNSRLTETQQTIIAGKDQSPTEQMNKFALQLFLQIHKTSERMQNFVVSPLSVATLISIITYGAEGETLSELTNVLGMKAEDVESLLSKLEMKADPHASLHMANLLATRPDIPLRKDFTNTIARHYRNTVTKVLDLSKAEERQKIDQWCQKQTGGMIPQITDSNDAVTVLLSAICFKALWEESFEDIHRMPFENADKSKVLLPGMSRLADMMVEDRAHYVALGLNYRGGRYKMLLLLPNKGNSVENVLNELTTSELEYLLKTKEGNTETKLEMPRFEMRFKQPLIPILQQMGIRLAFTPQASFRRMSDVPLYIANVEQRAYIEVNQKGTEASAATKASMAIGAFGVDETPSYRYICVDRPFMFVIGDSQTGVSLFMGEYRGDEKAKRI